MPAVGARSTRFETTSWSLVVAAAAAGAEADPVALADLCRRYWSPVYAFIRSYRFAADEAEDLTQSFFTRVIEKDYVGQADRSRGRFRNFLLASVRHFLANEFERRATIKRGGGHEHLSMDDPERPIDPAGPMSPEQVFMKRWALSVVEQVVADLRADAIAANRGEEFERLLPFAGGEGPVDGYGTLARETGMTEGALRVAVHRLRLRFRDRLRTTIAATVVDPSQVEDEIRFLIDAVSAREGPR